MYGLKVVGARGQVEIKAYTSGGAIAVGDPVVLKTDGQVEKATAGDPLRGVAISKATAASQTVYIKVGSRLRVLAENDNTGTTFAATHVGGRFDIVGNSGAVLVDTSTVEQVGDGTDAGELLCLAYNPQGYGEDSNTKVGLFEVIEEQ